MMKYPISTALLLAASTARSVVAFAPRRGAAPSSRLFLMDKLFGTDVKASNNNNKYPIYADESVMSQKAHGTSEMPVQKKLRWNCDYDTADRSKLVLSCEKGSHCGWTVRLSGQMGTCPCYRSIWLGFLLGFLRRCSFSCCVLRSMCCCTN
jgi:hypothetical protein